MSEQLKQEKLSKGDLERDLREQRENTFKVEELLGQTLSSLKEELQHQKSLEEEARLQAEEKIGSKLQEISQLEIRLQEESSLKVHLEAKMTEEKTELLREIDDKSANVLQLRTEVSAKEEQIGALEANLEQVKCKKAEDEQIFLQEQSISEIRRTELE